MSDDIITKITRIIQRNDGSEVRIVSEAMFGTGLNMSIATDVFRRESSLGMWKLCSDRPHPDWRTMSVDKYKEAGRSEKLKAASPGEMLSVAQWIGRPVSTLPSEMGIHIA